MMKTIIIISVIIIFGVGGFFLSLQSQKEQVNVLVDDNINVLDKIKVNDYEKK